MSEQSNRVVDVLVLTAMKVELDAFEERLAHHRAELGPEFGDFPVPIRRAELLTDGHKISIAFGRTHLMGESAAAVLAGTLLETLKPNIIAMCGVCAGKRGDTVVGDVIVGDRLFPFDHGKRVVTDGKIKHRQDFQTYNLKPKWKILAEDFGPQWASHFEKRPPTLDYQAHSLLRALCQHETTDSE